MRERASDFDPVLREMRRAFDDSFAVPPPEEIVDSTHDYVVILVAGRPFAMRISETGGLHFQRKIVELPGEGSGLLGLAGIQGHLVSVHGLAQLMGMADSPAGIRTIALCRGENSIGLGFGELRGYVRAAGIESPAEKAEGEGLCLSGAIRVPHGLCSVIDIPAVVKKIKNSDRGRMK